MKKWYLLECYANAFEHKDHLSCANCLNIVHKSTAFFHYIRCAARRKKRDPVVIPEADIFENLSRLTVAIKAEFSLKSWMDLAKCLLVSLYVLNDRIPSVESLLISDYNKSRTYNSKTDMELAEIIEDTHKVKYFMANDVSLKVVIQRNFIGMPVFLTSMQDGVVSLLLKYRMEAEVSLDNDYVFGCAAQDVNETRISLNDAIKDYVRDIHQKEVPTNMKLGLSSEEKDEEQFDFTSFDPVLWEPSVRLTRTDLAERLLRRYDENDECTIEIKNECLETIESGTSSDETLEKHIENEMLPTVIKIEDETIPDTTDLTIPVVTKDFPTTQICPDNIDEISTITSATVIESSVSVSDSKSQEKIVVALPSSQLKLSKRKKNKRKKLKDLSQSRILERNDDESDIEGTSSSDVKKPSRDPSVPIVPLDISLTSQESVNPSKISSRGDENTNSGLPITKAVLYPIGSSSKKKYTIKNIKILPLKPRLIEESSNTTSNRPSSSDSNGNDELVEAERKSEDDTSPQSANISNQFGGKNCTTTTKNVEDHTASMGDELEVDDRSIEYPGAKKMKFEEYQKSTPGPSSTKSSKIKKANLGKKMMHSKTERADMSEGCKTKEGIGMVNDVFKCKFLQF